ncbi:37936_t:CDS:1, partial [Gigaspora margarita]
MRKVNQQALNILNQLANQKKAPKDSKDIVKNVAKLVITKKA